MHSVALALIPWLDPQYILDHFGAIAVLVVCGIVFAETGLLIGFIFPGDSLLVITGLFAFDRGGEIGGIPVWVAALMIGAAAFLGGEPRLLHRQEGRATDLRAQGQRGSSRRRTSSAPTRSSTASAPSP